MSRWRNGDNGSRKNGGKVPVFLEIFFIREHFHTFSIVHFWQCPNLPHFPPISPPFPPHPPPPPVLRWDHSPGPWDHLKKGHTLKRPETQEV